MREFFGWLLALVAGGFSAGVTFVLMLGHEGIGPGDSLSLQGKLIPIAVGTAVAGAILWRSLKARE